MTSPAAKTNVDGDRDPLKPAGGTVADGADSSLPTHCAPDEMESARPNIAQVPANTTTPRPNLTINLSHVSRVLVEAVTPEEVIDLEMKLRVYEEYAKTWLPLETREVNELRMRARWKLGRLLMNEARGAGPGRGRVGENIFPTEKSFMALLRRIGLTPKAAMEAQRIAALPEGELERAFATARKNDVLNTFAELLRLARPYWYKESRDTKHRRIAEQARALGAGDTLGPFPLIYADPPWKFHIYSEKGLDRTPDQHYPTLTDEDIVDFKINGLRIDEIAARSAALFMWCTSSNLLRALDVMDAWGFEFKTSAVWVKDKSGLGLVFRNQHEILLYGTRGNMPGPQYQPSSVFQYPRGRHSAKPSEIREEIEKMYPNFDASTRLELFSREAVKGWTHHGFEANEI